MKTVQIARVSRINNDTANLIILKLGNGKPDVVRTPKEFLTDLRGSFLVDENVKSMNHPQVRRVMKNLRGGTLTGDLTYVKAGDKWQVTENSAVITNPKAKGFGQYEVGDMKEYEKDATIVSDGFLDFEVNDRAYQAELNADAYANKIASTASSFETMDFDSAPSSSEVAEVPDAPAPVATEENEVDPATASEAVGG